METQSMLHAAPRWLLGALLLAAAAVYTPARAWTSEPAIPDAAPLTSWHDNGHGGRYLLKIAEGYSMRTGARITGIVRSDSDCEPDAQGLSHCRNVIDLANGRRIVVIDTHEMSRNRCLGAGDRLSITAIGPTWLMGTLAKR